MEKTQNFSKGLNSDLSPVYQQEGTYVDALNIEVIDDELQGSVAISNSKGNKFQISIPNTTAIVKLTLTSGGVSNITINGQTGAGTTIVTMKDLYDYMQSDVAYTFLGVQYDIYYTDLTLLIYPRAGFTTVVTGTPAGTSINNTYVPARSNLEVIGYEILRDDIYLFTTNNDSLDPQTTGNGYGFIWKLTYDNIGFTAAGATISLIFAGDLSFSTYWNIPQTGVVGRYENSGTQRLYWTDNYNRLRSLNVADPQIGALDVSLIDVEPSVDFDIPLLSDIRSAAGTTTIKIGCYQVAYRLSNTGGSSTTYSLPSNPVFVVNAAEELQTAGANWKDYRGDVLGTATTKRITWTVNNLDRDFTRIEAVVLIRETKNAIPTIYSFYEGPVISDSTDIVLDGDILASNDTTIVAIDDFLALSSVFTHCKTIGTKDNRLVAANVRNELSDIDFDARAYRHKAANDFDIIENGAVVNYPTADYTTVVETSDAISTFNVEATDPGNYDPNSKYKADGTTIGGEGTNISYEFVSVAVACDFDSNLNSDPQALPIVHTNPDYTTNKLNLNVFSSDKNGTDVLQEYNLLFPSPINDGMKFPQMNSIYWGYQHNEIYRVGIEFYDKSKNYYFTKWIGDIRMPDYFDACPAANHVYEDGSLTGFTDYRKSFTVAPGVHGANESYACQLGIKFSISIPASLTDKVGGYSIVRVRRLESDKTIVSEGLIPNVLSEYAPGGGYFLPVGDMDYSIAAAGSIGADLTKVNFLTPNILDATLITPAAGMKLRIASYLSPSNVLQDVNIVGGAGPDKCKILKMYDHSASAPFETPILFSALVGTNSSIADGGNTYNNLSFPLANNTSNGNPAYFMSITFPIPGTVSGTDKFFAHVFNPIINQYGGNTYTDRGSNEYIVCSEFRSIKSNTTGYTDSILLYGGDVTSSLMDEERISKYWAALPDILNSTTFFYPASSPVNRELRHGRHPNTHLTDVPTADNDRTDYFYNTVYSCMNDIIVLAPKPVPFTEVTVYDNRFYISEIKINGESSDSWSIFKSNNYWDVEGDKGPVNSMLALGDKMYFWQDRAFGIIEINPRTMITDTNNSANSQVNVGTGLPLQRHDYISTVVGTKHQGSTISSSNKLYWFDVNTKKIYTYSQGSSEMPFSDVKGLYSYLGLKLDGEIQNVDKPVYDSGTGNIGINGVVATYDYKKHKAIFTFHSGRRYSLVPDVVQTSFTVVINEITDAFTTFHSFTPKVYINDYKHFFSTNRAARGFLRDIYIHDKGEYGDYYTVTYPSYIKFIVNQAPQYTKVFDNIMYDSQATAYDSATNTYVNYNNETWNWIRITNDYQNTGIQALIVNTNIFRKERTWKLAVPRNRVLYTSTDSPNIYVDLSPTDKTYGERMRDKYIQVELTYDNTSNRELKTNNFTTVFRQSPR